MGGQNAQRATISRHHQAFPASSEWYGLLGVGGIGEKGAGLACAERGWIGEKGAGLACAERGRDRWSCCWGLGVTLRKRPPKCRL